MMKCLPLALGVLLSAPCRAKEELKGTEFTLSDALQMMNAKGWSFTYTPSEPVKKLDVLVYEIRTNGNGDTTTTVRLCGTLGMLPREQDFPIKILLISNTIRVKIDSAGMSSKLSDEFSTEGGSGYRITRANTADEHGRIHLVEVGGPDGEDGKSAFKTELKFKVFPNLSPEALELHLNNGVLPGTI